MTAPGPPVLLPPHLVTLVREGAVALVLGAGASYGAKHPSNKKIPLGPELRNLLSDRFLSGSHRDDSLAEVAELCESVASTPLLQEYIAQDFGDFSPAPHHQLLPTFKWHGIATLNYDLILERSYNKTDSQILAPIYSDDDRVEDHRRSPKHILYLKLHGCLTRINDSRIPLILTTDQYITHRSHRNNLFRILEDWARDKTLLFVGTSLQDPDIRRVLLELGQDSRWKNRHYLVVPQVSAIKAQFWSERKIEVVQCGFEHFLAELDRLIPRLGRSISLPPTVVPCFARFNRTDPVLTRSALDSLQNDLEWVHPGMGAPIVHARDFYRGSSQGWAPILQNLDVQRHLTQRVLQDVVLEAPEGTRLELAVVKAPAGAGKTVLLRRAAWTAALDLDALCFFVKAGALPSGEILCEIADVANRRIFLFVEDLAYDAPAIARACSVISRRKCPITIIGTARSNEWNVACDVIEPFVSHEFDLLYLSQTEVRELLGLLERHRALGTLENEDPASRERAFMHKAGRQLLVALHEATLGESFSKIVKNEFDKLVPQLAQDIYLTICCLNRTGVPVRAGLISRIHGVSLDDFTASFLEPLEHVVLLRESRHAVDAEYSARHPHIADFVFREVLNDSSSRFDRLMLIMDSLNPSYESDQASLEHLIRARTIKEWLFDDRLIEAFYLRAETRLDKDGHVFLQHGLFEMNRINGDLEKAGQLLSRATELLPKNPIVTHASAELECRLATRAPSGIAAERHVSRAIAMATALTSKRVSDTYGYTVLAKAELIRLKRQLNDTSLMSSDETIIDTIRRVESAISTGFQYAGPDPYLSETESELAKVLKDELRVRKALEAAVARNTRNPNIVNRLSKIYESAGDVEKAVEVLKLSIDRQPHEPRLHMTMAEVLYRHGDDGLLLEYHLSHAFSPSFPNEEAHFMYARQLFINGKLSQAKEQFGKLFAQTSQPGLRRVPRSPWMENAELKRFRGTVSRLDAGYGFVTRDGSSESRIFISRNTNSEFLWTSGSYRSRVSFGIAFNLQGPIAIELELE